MLWIIPASVAALVFAGVIAANTPEKRELRATNDEFVKRKKSLSAIMSCREIYRAVKPSEDGWVDKRASRRCDAIMSAGSLVINGCGESKSYTTGSVYIMEVYTPKMIEKALATSPGDPFMLYLDVCLKRRPLFKGYVKALFAVGGSTPESCDVYYMKSMSMRTMKAMAEKQHTLRRNTQNIMAGSINRPHSGISHGGMH